MGEPCRLSWPRLLRRCGVIVGAAVLVFAVGSVIEGARALRSGIAEARRGATSADASRLTAAAASFSDAADELRRSRTLLGPVSSGMGWVPGLGSSLRLAHAEAAAAETASAAASDLASLASRVGAGPSLDVRPLGDAAPLLARYAEILEQRLGALGRASAGGWSLGALSGGREQLLARGPALVRALRGWQAAAMLATPGRRYLLLFQNPAELRATGGLIGAWGLLETGEGRVRLAQLARNTALPRPRAPVAAPNDYLARYGRFGATAEWANANMSPDFPTSARVLLNLYRAAGGRHVDGVMALDAVALDALLDATGPIYVGERQLERGSFLSTALVDSYQGSAEVRTGELLAGAREGWRRLRQGADLVAVGRALGTAARSGHIRAFAVDTPTQAALTAARIAGAVARPAGDYLLVVAQNAGGNKLDYYLRARVDATVRLDWAGNAVTRSVLELHNNAPRTGLASYAAGVQEPGARPGMNRSYLSVYAARNARMLAFEAGTQRTAESAEELGHPVFSWFHAVPPQASRRATLRISAPGVVRPQKGGLWTYRLLVQSQPQLNPPKLALAVTLPRGACLRRVEGESPQVRGSIVRYQMVLDRDRRISLIFSPCSPASRGTS